MTISARIGYGGMISLHLHYSIVDKKLPTMLEDQEIKRNFDETETEKSQITRLEWRNVHPK